MASARLGGEVADLQARLVEDLTSITGDLGAKAAKRRKVRKLLAEVVENGPSAFTVGKTARHTQVPPAGYLNMTAGNHWPWSTPSLNYALRAQQMSATHIFDAFAVRTIGSDPALEQALKDLEITMPLVTEATLKDLTVKINNTPTSIMQWAKVVKVDSMDAMRGVEAIRQRLHPQNREDHRPPDPIRHLGRAEAIATALLHAQAGEPVRIVTDDSRLIADYQRFGVPSTSICGIFDTAANEGELSPDVVEKMSELQQRHDPFFQPEKSRWPQRPASLSNFEKRSWTARTR